MSLWRCVSRSGVGASREVIALERGECLTKAADHPWIVTRVIHAAPRAIRSDIDNPKVAGVGLDQRDRMRKHLVDLDRSRDRTFDGNGPGKVSWNCCSSASVRPGRTRMPLRSLTRSTNDTSLVARSATPVRHARHQGNQKVHSPGIAARAVSCIRPLRVDHGPCNDW